MRREQPAQKHADKSCGAGQAGRNRKSLQPVCPKPELPVQKRSRDETKGAASEQPRIHKGQNARLTHPQEHRRKARKQRRAQGRRTD